MIFDWDPCPIKKAEDEETEKGLDYSHIHIPKLGDNMPEDDILEEDETLEKSPDSDIVRGILDDLGDPGLKEYLTGWLAENDLEKDDTDGMVEEVAEEIAEKVEDIVEEVLGGGASSGAEMEPDLDKSDDEDEDEDEEPDLEKSEDEDEDEDEVGKSWTVPVFKSRDQQIAYGVVSEPDTEDLQGDILTAGEIQKACHQFMRKSQKIGHEHKGQANVDIIESYIAPLDFECGGQIVRKGSWVMGVKINDPLIWRAVKTGDITGFSIAGTGVRTPA